MEQQSNSEARDQSDRVCLHAISKRYGAVAVLDNVSFSIKKGEVHGLLGANGAGKSTLCKILSGLTRPTAGQIFLDDKPIEVSNKRNAESLGIEIVQQELNLIPTLSVAENLLLKKLPSRLGIISRNKLNREATQLLEKVGLEHLSTSALTRNLGIGQQQLIEIAKALRSACKLLILDEPTASLSNVEAENLFQRIAELKKLGTSILYISHRLDEVKLICDRVTILRDGKHILTQKSEQMSTDEMVAWMSGEVDKISREQSHLSLKTAKQNLGGDLESATEPLMALRVKNLSCGLVQDVSFEVREKEVFGITGLVGSGRTELLRAIFGADRPSSGAIFLHGSTTPRLFSSPAQAVEAGLAMVTEDRKSTGLLLSHSIVNNATLSSMGGSYSRWGIFRNRVARNAVEKTCNHLATKYLHLNQIVSTLSGGNQQKVVIAKWLLRGAKVFLFDEPTRGIDVAARQIIYDVIRKIANEGSAVLIVSSDLDELFALSNRIAVMSRGRIVDLLEKNAFDKRRVTSASFSGLSSQSHQTLVSAPIDPL